MQAARRASAGTASILTMRTGGVLERFIYRAGVLAEYERSAANDNEVAK